MKLTLPVATVSTMIAAMGFDVRAQMVIANPFGIASGAEWSGDYPKFQPMLKDAGVGWIRYFDGWEGIRPRRGEWNWKWADEFVGL